MDAVIIFTGPDTKNSYVVQISNLSISDDETLTLEVTPKKYYEGEALKLYTTVNQTAEIVNELTHYRDNTFTRFSSDSGI
jgi:hypothetical protein